jgi:hypothetical protein
MTTIIDPKQAWTSRAAVTFGIFVAMSSVLGLTVVSVVDEWLDYRVPHLVGIPLLFGTGIGWPIAVLVLRYKKLYPLSTLLVFIVAFAVGWSVSMFTFQTMEFGPWKGLRDNEGTLLHLLSREGVRLGIVLAVSLVMGWLVWGVCRLVRGKSLIQDGTRCEHCGYCLIGNESGRCPECGTAGAIREQSQEQPLARRTPGWVKIPLIALAAGFAWAVYSHF